MSENNVQSNEHSETLSRRGLLKLGAVGGAALVTGQVFAGTPEAMSDTRSTVKFTEHDEFPYEIKPEYRPFKPENNEFIRDFKDNIRKYGSPTPPQYAGDHALDESKPGFRRFEYALSSAPWAWKIRQTGFSMYGQPNKGEFGWDFKPQGEPYEFETPKLASDVIKRAAKLYGADLVGIAPQDSRWDYAHHYDFQTDEIATWEKDFPFKPKTVIVMAFEMDYEALSAGPTNVSGAATGVGYARMSHTAAMLAEFIRNLGHNAVAAGNDLALSVPYAVAAGLGEGSRMGLLVTYQYGPRVRLAKVFTDLELVEYDKPKTFGVRSFCERCQRCSESCPANAIDKRTEATFEPPEGGFRPFHNPGIKKWYNSAEKCRDYWHESDTDCATCITACPYNKPDFWQHRMIEKLNSIVPGPVHTFMKEMDIWYGFGDTFDEKAVGTFWSADGRGYDGRR